MGCVKSKIQKTDKDFPPEYNNSSLSDNESNNRINNADDKVVDYYDLPYKGKDEIL